MAGALQHVKSHASLLVCCTHLSAILSFFLCFYFSVVDMENCPATASKRIPELPRRVISSPVLPETKVPRESLLTAPSIICICIAGWYAGRVFESSTLWMFI